APDGSSSQTNKQVNAAAGGSLLKAAVEQGKAQIRLPDQPGCYELTYDDGAQIERILSVNPSPKESQLAFVESPEAMKMWEVTHAGDPVKAAPVKPAQRISASAILQQRVWWW